MIDENIAVVFELEDTLYKEIDFVKSALCELASFVDKKDIFLPNKLFGMFRKKENIFEYLATKYDKDISALKIIYENHKPNLALDDKTKSTISKLKTNKNKLGIITDGKSITQRAKIKALGLDQYIDFIVISEESGHLNNELHNFEYISSALGTQRCIYIGSRFSKDFVACKLLDFWDTIGLLDDGKNLEIQDFSIDKSYLPEYFIDTIEGVLDF